MALVTPITKAPVCWLDTVTYADGKVQIPLAAIAGLDAAEAAAATGDIRKILFGLLESLYAVYVSTGAAATVGRMVMSKSANADLVTGAGMTTFNVRFTTATASAVTDVADEA